MFVPSSSRPPPLHYANEPFAPFSNFKTINKGPLFLFFFGSLAPSSVITAARCERKQQRRRHQRGNNVGVVRLLLTNAVTQPERVQL